MPLSSLPSPDFLFLRLALEPVFGLPAPGLFPAMAVTDAGTLANRQTVLRAALLVLEQGGLRQQGKLKIDRVQQIVTKNKMKQT